MSRKTSVKKKGATEEDVAIKGKLASSRQRLLDLTLRNRLLNFKPGSPTYSETKRSQKHLTVKGHLESVWDRLVEKSSQIEIHPLTKELREKIARENRQQNKVQHLELDGREEASEEEEAQERVEWDVIEEMKEVDASLRKGNLISLLSEDAFQRRTKKIKAEQDTLINSTGDSALFLAIGFLEWYEREGSARAGESFYAPLVLAHCHLSQGYPSEGGQKIAFLEMDADQPQGNPCLVEFLKKEFDLELPDLSEEESASDYLDKIEKAIQKRKTWKVHRSLTLGFFNFSRYRLWLDLNPSLWPEGTAPHEHELVRSILSGNPLPQQDRLPTENEIAKIQASQDLPLVLNADSTQYAAIVAAIGKKNLVIQGPPGSGKSQTITNLVAAALSEGLKVLFVAQKLPALQVVYSRLQSVKLGAFCLPIFSDKARVASVHEQIKNRIEISSLRKPKPIINNAGNLAQQLNDHAALLRSKPPGHEETVSDLIQRAVALRLSAMDGWGEDWSESFLEVEVPSSEPSHQWMEEREKCLREWFRLGSDTKNTWRNWKPLGFGPLDGAKLEERTNQFRNSLTACLNIITALPTELHQLTLQEGEKLSEEFEKHGIFELKNASLGLLRYLWGVNPSSLMMTSLERDIRERESNLEEAAGILLFDEKEFDSNLSKISNALREVISSLPISTTVDEGIERHKQLVRLRSSIKQYREAAEDKNGLFSSLNDGGSRILTFSDIAELSSYQGDIIPKLGPEVDLALAKYIVLVPEGRNEAVALKLKIEKADNVLKGLEFNEGVIKKIQDDELLPKQVSAVSSIPLKETPLAKAKAILDSITDLIVRVRKFDDEDLIAFSVGFNGKTDKLSVVSQDVEFLKSQKINLEAPCQTSLFILQNHLSQGIEDTQLPALCSIMGQYTELLEAINTYLTELEFGGEIPASLQKRRIELISFLRKLNAPNIRLSRIKSIKFLMDSLFEATTNIVNCAAPLDKCPTLRIQTLADLKKTREALQTLREIPAGIKADDITFLSSVTNLNELKYYIEKLEGLQKFEENLKGTITFRDLPPSNELADIRRKVRPYVGKWLPWLSKGYREVKVELRAFMLMSHSANAGLIEFLDNLETHVLAKESLQESPVGVRFSTKSGTGSKDELKNLLAWFERLSVHLDGADPSRIISSFLEGPDGIIKLQTEIGSLISILTNEHDTLSSFEEFSDDFRFELLEEFCAQKANISSQILEFDHFQNKAKQDELICVAIEKLEALSEYSRILESLSRFEGIATIKELAECTVAGISENIEWRTALKANVPGQVFNSLLSGKCTPADYQEFLEVWNSLFEGVNSVSRNYPELGLNALFDHTSVEAEKHLSALQSSLISIYETTTTLSIKESLTFDEWREVLQAIKARKTAQSLHAKLHGERKTLSTITSQSIEFTLKWLDSIEGSGVSSNLIGWIVESNPKARLAWIQSTVFESQTFINRTKEAFEGFLSKYFENEDNEAFDVWESRIEAKTVAIANALEVIKIHCKASGVSCEEIVKAANHLIDAKNIGIKIEELIPVIGVSPCTFSSNELSEYTSWILALKRMPERISKWMLDGEPLEWQRSLLDLQKELSVLIKHKKSFGVLVRSYGEINESGPFDVFDEKLTFKELSGNLFNFHDSIPILPSYASFLQWEESANQFNLQQVLEAGRNPKASAELLVTTFRAAVTWTQARNFWENNESLSVFQSNEYERIREQFRSNDSTLLEKNRKFLAQHLAAAEVDYGSKGKTASEHTQLSLLQHELGKKRRHLSIRKLVERSAESLLDLFPCWMLTPTAVAQFLPPGRIEFDIVIMDEASQLNPEDAWGVIARAKQAVVVGDHKQMPPSDFFSASFEDSDSDDEDDTIDGGKSESILVAAMSSLWSSTLQWHYRSKHQSLIQPANSFSYENKLILFPSSTESHPEYGIGYTYAEGCTTTGKVTNPIEAKAVIGKVRETLLREFSKNPSSRKSIGVVSMNLAQQDCLMDILEKARTEDRRLDEALRWYEADDREEPFFIRNLENIQGDERDIIFISCTYGPQTIGGTPAQRFGPLNREGGERRFNVLITRSKWRMEVFSSIKSSQIIVGEGKHRGVKDFHLFLKFAESGELPEVGENLGAEFMSPFEEQVTAVLRQEGYMVEPQVGVAGYFIDLGVRHPKNSGLYAIGIECDGRSYHSSRVARDRDRLREDVLKERGWKLHRIWSTDWFVNPKHAKKKLLEAVARACI